MVAFFKCNMRLYDVYNYIVIETARVTSENGEVPRSIAKHSEVSVVSARTTTRMRGYTT